MTAAPDQHDLKQWMEDWQSADRAAPPEESIRRFVERRTRKIRIWFAGDMVLGGGILAFLLHRTITHPDPIEKLAMGALALITVATIGFGLWNWRGVRSATAQTTQAFVTLSIARAARLRRAIRVGWLVLAAEVTVYVPWVWYRLYGHGSPPPGAERFGWSFLAGMTALAVVFLYSMTAQAARDERRLAALQEEIDDD